MADDRTALLVMDVHAGIVGRAFAGKVFPRQAEVTSVADWVAGLSS
ncbi:hypothetical protein HDA40_002543 [Hamadaea flava]|uniref:Uncharacterized protein n=1 Tax=Hamadaea flava TaxID=1742688 RepID=A0ABV8LKS4_9ACTN|nr:hypothetical protein [Hamadaea flava]MCP2324036.1 hypothetical protein [Hamadaea flava]